MNSSKYKSVLCKHFGQTGTCSYGDKCQFAHGFQELKNSGGQGQTGNGRGGDGLSGTPQTLNLNSNNEKNNKQPPNPSNFKIVKCKNFEANGSCKYGSVCTFAHGDTELRTKSDNNLQMSENAITMNTLDNQFMPMQGNPYLMQDPSYIYNLMLQQQMYDMSGQQTGGMNQGQGQGMTGGVQGQLGNFNQFQGQGGQGGVFPGQNSNGDLNLNDMNNNPFLIGMSNMMNNTDPNSINNNMSTNNNSQPSTENNNVPSNL